MKRLRVKYNPGFLEPAELIEQFVVRTFELDALDAIVRGNATASINQHVLIIGPRGSGKSMLACRVDARIGEDAALRAAWRVIRLGEELPTASSPGELWLDALQRLVDETDDPVLREDVQSLRREPDDTRLEARAFSRLMDFADAARRKLMLVVENLDALFDERQMGTGAGWSVRQRLQTEPRLMLLGTATVRFDAMENADAPFFEMFQLIVLRPLNREQCQRVWCAVTGRDLSIEEARAVQILTGGSPRLVATMAQFNADRPADRLMDGLLELMDDHTAYLKACIEDLPVQERKAFIALADLWKPSSAGEVAERARMEGNAASVHLRRLVNRGAVEEAGQIGRVRLYQVTERLFNIYHLLRHRAGPDQRVRALLEMMRVFYRPGSFDRATGSVADAATNGAGAEYAQALRRMQAETRGYVWATQALDAQRSHFEGLPALPGGVRPETEDRAFLVSAGEIMAWMLGEAPTAPPEDLVALNVWVRGYSERVFERAGQSLEPDAAAWDGLLAVPKAAIAAIEESDGPTSDNPHLWYWLGILWLIEGSRKDALAAMEQVYRLEPRHLGAIRILADAAKRAGDAPTEKTWRRRAAELEAACVHDWVEYLDLVADEDFSNDPDDLALIRIRSHERSEIGRQAREMMACTFAFEDPQPARLRQWLRDFETDDLGSGAVAFARTYAADQDAPDDLQEAFLAGIAAPEPFHLSVWYSISSSLPVSDLALGSAIERLTAEAVDTLAFAMATNGDFEPSAVAKWGGLVYLVLARKAGHNDHTLSRLALVLGRTTRDDVTRLVADLALFLGGKVEPDDFVKQELTRAAAAHYGREVLELIDTPAHPALAPYACAIRRDLGESPIVPVEIGRVAEDVLEQIQRQRAYMTEVQRLIAEREAAAARPKRKRSAAKAP